MGPTLQEPPLVPLAYATLASNTLELPLPALQFLPNKNQPLAQPTLQEPPLVPLAHATPASNSLETPLSALLSQLEMVSLPNKMPLAQPTLQEPPLVPLAYATLASNTLEPPLPALQFLPNKMPLA